MHPVRLIVKAWHYYREYGLTELRYRIHGARRFAVLRKRLQGEWVERAYRDVQFRVACPDDVAMVCGLYERYKRCEAPIDVVDRIRAHELTVLGVSPADSRMVMYVSVASRNNQLFGLLPEDVAGPDDACSQGIWVPSICRKQGIAVRGLGFVEYAAAQAGVRQLWAFVKVGNAASLALHQTLGYEQFGLLRAGRRLGTRMAELRQTGQRGWQSLVAESDG
ncbi:MAG: GNAT family protein [Patescibacteria group bacterium]|nr:GNAT family protein [Patescibacteria group bacterium]